VTTTVTALLVSHDGARWLPTVLDGLAAQTRRVDRAVAVDTGSKDPSADLLRQRLGDGCVQYAPGHLSYGAAVAAGLKALPPAAGPGSGTDEWIWLLHDDSAPAPDALEQLLAVAAENPSVDILGPKLREWPSLRRLLEVGVTISGTGRRETGLERGEYDQGQHDRIRDVLAVNTAGMLVRRHVLEELGFEERLPVFGNDIDFGWRAARAGHRALVAPDAVVFHVEAATRGVRVTPVTTFDPQRAQRRGALFTLLANCRGRALPFQLLRLLLGSLLRAIGFLLVRSPGEAWDEIAALASVYVHPGRVISARRARRRSATVPAAEVRHLLAAPWVPYRHGLDYVGDIVTAAALQAGDMSAARRSRVEAAETGPVPEEAQELPEDTGVVARLVRSPVAGLFALLVVISIVAGRNLLGGGLLSGGALLPAPDSASYWWHSYLESWHDIGVGASAPAAPYLLPLAMLASVLAGKAWLVIGVLFVMAVPLAAWGAYRFLRRVTGSRPMAMWGAVAYGVLPVVSGAVQEGRLGTVAAAIVLPWLATSAVYLGPEQTDDRRWRAAARTTLWLALLVAFVPFAWVLALVVALVALGGGLLQDRDAWSRRAVWAAVLTPLGASLVLLLPWTVMVWMHQGPWAMVFEAGLPAPELTRPLSRLDVLLDRPGLWGAPAWLAWGIPAAALASLLRPDTRPQVLRAWAVLVAALVLTAVLAPVSAALPTAPDARQPIWLGFPLLVVAAAGITAAALAGTGIRGRFADATFGWRQPVGLVVVVVAVATAVGGLAWWTVTGSGRGPIEDQPASDVPVYMTDESAIHPMHGVLVVRGSQHGGFEYQVLRTPGMRTGDDSLLPSADEQRPLSVLVTRLAAGPQASDIAALRTYGIGFVYLAPPADTQMSANLDSASGISTGSAGVAGARAWQLVGRSDGSALAEPDGGIHTWLLLLQAFAILTAAVFAAPTRKVER
jgi:GT2 family glycosyltransferase